MTLRDTRQGYSWLSIVFHWMTAVTVIALWLIAEIAEDASEDQEASLMGLHVSIAMSVYLILWARIFWRMFVARPALAPQKPVFEKLALWIPRILLAGIAIMLCSGPLMVWSAGYDIAIFDLITLPTPMEKSEDFHELMEEAHELGANILYFGVIVHVLGGLKHLLIDRDNTLLKILKPGNTPD